MRLSDYFHMLKTGNCRALIYKQDALDVEERIRLEKQNQGLSTLVMLLQQGVWSSREAAKYCGVSRYAIEKQLAAARCQRASITPVSVGS